MIFVISFILLLYYYMCYFFLSYYYDICYFFHIIIVLLYVLFLSFILLLYIICVISFFHIIIVFLTFYCKLLVAETILIHSRGKSLEKSRTYYENNQNATQKINKLKFTPVLTFIAFLFPYCLLNCYNLVPCLKICSLLTTWISTECKDTFLLR